MAIECRAALPAARDRSDVAALLGTAGTVGDHADWSVRALSVRQRLADALKPDVTSPADLDARLSGWKRQGSGQILAGFDAPPGSVVLDVGCGENPHSAFLADCDVEIVLADIDADAVVAAARAVRHFGSVARVREIVTDSAPLPLPDECADRIVATEVLEHVADEKDFLRELVRVGRPGSRYLLSVPHRRSEELQVPFAAPDYFTPPNHVRVFGEGEFVDLVTSAGLTVTHRQFDGFYQTMWWLMFWISAQPTFTPPWRPMLASWMETWEQVLRSPRGPELKKVLDEALPKSEVVIAVKQ